MSEPREWWIVEARGDDYYDTGERVDTSPSGSTIEIHVIEKYAFDALKVENEQLRSALTEIANEDFRGNRSSGSVIAYKTLQTLKDQK